MEKLLILGANPETVSLIEKAKEMGFYTIVTDYDPEAYAKRYADEAADIDATDVDRLVALARDRGVSGVLVGVAEALLPAYCKVCERLGLPAYSTADRFEIMTRKDCFKRKCEEYGVPTVRAYDLSDLDSIIFPVVVKPVDSCSSKGIRVCRDQNELKMAVQYAVQFSRSGKYLIEEYMTGDEVIVYYVMQDGNPTFAAMCDRYTYKPKEGLIQLPTSYIYPSRHVDSYTAHFDQAVRGMIKGIDLDNGSVFFQCFVDQEGIVRVYEAGYRLNGAQEHIITSKVSGIDAREIYINYALKGRAADIDLSSLANPKPRQICCKLSPIVRTGRISKICGLEEIRALADVVSVNPSYRDGDTVKGEGTLKQIVCRFFIVSETKEDLKKTIDQIQTCLHVVDDEGREMLTGLFDSNILNMLY